MVGISLPGGGAVMDALHGILLGYDGSPGGVGSRVPGVGH